MEKLGETLLYLVFALAAIGVIIFAVKACQTKQDDLTGKKILCPLNPEACKQKEQDQAAIQTGGANPPSLKESLEKCYTDKKPDCPEGFQALNQAVAQQGKSIEVKNDEEVGVSQMILSGKNIVETLSFGFPIMACDQNEPAQYSAKEIHMQPGPKKDIHINFVTGDTYSSDWWHTATGLGYQLQNVQRLCLYYEFNRG